MALRSNPDPDPETALIVTFKGIAWQPDLPSVPGQLPDLEDDEPGHGERSGTEQALHHDAGLIDAAAASIAAELEDTQLCTLPTQRPHAGDQQ
jgi:hypothetical protein